MNNASSFNQGVDFAFYFIIGSSVVLLVGITIVMIYFLVKYRKKNNPVPTHIEGNSKLELIWTIIPTILVLVMFYYGWTGYTPMRALPEGAMEVKAVGRMWSWTFEYQNGKMSDKLYVPLNQPVKLNLVSMDVNHNLYIPAFRVKEDVVPGRENKMWFQAQKPGSYDILCAEYCGQRHSYMITKLEVLPEKEFKEWMAKGVDTSNVSSAEKGYDIIRLNGCIGCHSTDGSKLVGPTFKGLFGATRHVIEGGKEITIVADTAYIRESIENPNAKIEKGYNPGQMPPYKGVIKDKQLLSVYEYLKSIGEGKK